MVTPEVIVVFIKPLKPLTFNSCALAKVVNDKMNVITAVTAFIFFDIRFMYISPSMN